MSQPSEWPDYLQPTYQLLKCAFPDEITEEEYEALLYLVQRHMSQRLFAELLATLTSKSYIHILNDAMGYEGEPTVDAMIIDVVRKRLDKCGYSDWLDEQRFPGDLD